MKFPERHKLDYSIKPFVDTFNVKSRAKRKLDGFNRSKKYTLGAMKSRNQNS